MVENRFVTRSSPLLQPPLEARAAEAGRRAKPASRSLGLERSDIEALIGREYHGLRLLLTRRVGNAHVAADLLNDAICTTWEKWQAGRIERPEQIVGYIFQVALNLLRNHRRAAAERPERRASPKVLEDLAQEPPDEGVQEHIAARVRRLLLDLSSPRDRVLLVRFYLNEEEGEAICRDMNLTPQQFARVLHRARGRLRALVEAHGISRSDLFSILAIM